MPIKKKRKIPITFLIVGGLVSAAIGYYVNAAWHQGIEFKEFKDNLMDVLSYPLRDYYDGTTIKAVVIAVLIFLLVMLAYYTTRHTLITGREYGTAKFITTKMMNKALSSNKSPGAMGDYRIISQNVRMNIDPKIADINANMLIIGGSGGGKTFKFVKPNLLQMVGSYVVTDPKGEILRSVGGVLKDNGYQVKVLNLIDMDKSDGYNPFDYIRNENDINLLVRNIIENTNAKNINSSADPFWEKAEEMFFLALFFYVWYEMGKKERNMRTVMKLLGQARVNGNNEPSELDRKMNELAMTSQKGFDHPAVRNYLKVMSGAADTVRSVIISANARMARLENDSVLRILDHDDMHFEELGIGYQGDEQTKTALFCIIPDNDKTYNFIIGMLYTQAFQRLYYMADNLPGGRLPIHVSFFMDEFANVALPDGFISLISTMRGRSISAVVILQNLVQIKALFKEEWENVTGNCDTTLFLGSNEQTTKDYMSKMLGKATIEKMSTGENRGRQGSSSRNYDHIQRDLMTPDEVGKLARNKCIIYVNGHDPAIDDKFDTTKHKRFKESADGGGKPFLLIDKKKTQYTAKPFELLCDKSVRYYQRRAEENPDKVFIDTVTLAEFLSLDDEMMNDRFTEIEKEAKLNKVNEDGYSNELEYMPESDTDDGVDRIKLALNAMKQGQPPTVEDRLKEFDFTYLQQQEIMRAVAEGIPVEYILTYAYPENNVMNLALYRAKYKPGAGAHM